MLASAFDDAFRKQAPELLIFKMNDPEDDFPYFQACILENLYRKLGGYDVPVEEFLKTRLMEPRKD